VDDFTEEERRLIAAYLRSVQKRIEIGMWYAAYVVLSLLFAVYGLLNQDFAAALVAYLALLGVALMDLSYTFQHTNTFRSLLRKYERVSVL
jgi:hypothetical protein